MQHSNMSHQPFADWPLGVQLVYRRQDPTRWQQHQAYDRAYYRLRPSQANGYAHSRANPQQYGRPILKYHTDQTTPALSVKTSGQLSTTWTIHIRANIPPA
ncbi:hypothetical protein B0A55_09350 [Friedmanniomyces simplex]|uniref:Uncharacterized protein n=1 Tax=Friedmanniomyces simplex TaxID=329884 RepID=A0A4U0WQD0_9PEZI|nr:hypothetical protein B0A55_09350 [Friedmanniomyces simplex]